MCCYFQEVETEQFHSFFQPELESDGYSGIFSAKSRARTMSENERKHVDGCAIFYRTSKYVSDFVLVISAFFCELRCVIKLLLLLILLTTLYYLKISFITLIYIVPILGWTIITIFSWIPSSFSCRLMLLSAYVCCV